MRSISLPLLFSALTLSTLSAAERQATQPSSIRIREGFQVELLHSAQEEEGSWISMTFDDQGRIIVGGDKTGILRVTLKSETSDLRVEKLAGTEQFKHCRGVLYAYDSLYVSATDSKGFYRLRDLDQDGTFEEIQLLKDMDYRSRYGHGTNQITLGPDGMIYVVNGNDVRFPDGFDPRSPYRDPHNDWLLPSPHDAGQDDRVGHILRMSPDGREWTVIAGGLRNQVDVAFNADGEMFTWDADMELDYGLPWYRPTRINHVVSGGEYGWRWGSGKWPEWYPDSLPSTCDTGFGSPTGVVFGTNSQWPERYRNVLYGADWQNGRILMFDVIPAGASYRVTSELFAEGGPLNVCDLVFGPDGAMYFITGGRGSQTGLYRVTYVGGSLPEPAGTAPGESEAAAVAARQMRQLRHQLEELHVRQDPRRIDFIWQHLGSDDVWLRWAARVALENQPVDTWRDRVDTAADSLAKQTALLALARSGEPSDQKRILKGLQQRTRAADDVDGLLLLLRTLQLTFIRQGIPDAGDRAAVLQQIDAFYPHASYPVNRLLGELLVFLDAPRVIERTLDLLGQAPTQEEQVQYVKTLTRVRQGWTRRSRERVLNWLYENRQLPGGSLVKTALKNLRADTEASLSPAEREELAPLLAKLDEPLPSDVGPALPPRPFVRQWTLPDLLDDVTANGSGELSAERGRQALAAATCLRCHRFGDRGGQIGPDLSAVGKRFDGRVLLESILEPAKVIDPKYLYSAYQLQDGRVVTGRPVAVSRETIKVETDPLSANVVTIQRDAIVASKISDVSPMPQGLLNTLTREEILDLIAYLRSGAGR